MNTADIAASMRSMGNVDIMNIITMSIIITMSMA